MTDKIKTLHIGPNRTLVDLTPYDEVRDFSIEDESGYHVIINFFIKRRLVRIIYNMPCDITYMDE